MSTEVITQTGYPGDGGREIPQFPERLEKEVGNIIGSLTAQNDYGQTFILDKEGFLYEILDYIIKRDEHIHKTDKASS